MANPGALAEGPENITTGVSFMGQATEIILDPKGNGHRDGRQWMAFQRTCLRRLAPAEVTVVDGPEEASQAARQSAMRGYRKIVSFGDDATAHGMINGLMSLADHHRRQIKAGILSFTRPFSPANRWSRTLALPRGLEKQLDVLEAGHTLPFDVGRMEGQALDGSHLTRFFINGAVIGLAGRLRREWRNPDAHLVNTLPRLAEALRDTHPSRAPRIRLESMGMLLYEGSLGMAWLMGGRHYPTFGAIAPQADPSDGLLELAWTPAAPWWELALRTAQLRFPGLTRKGNTLSWRGVEQVRATLIAGTQRGGHVEVELDGQPSGRLPATFSVVRHALQVMVSQVAVKLHTPKPIPVEKMRNGQLAGNLKSASGL